MNNRFLPKRTRDILINSGPGLTSGRVRSKYAPHIGKKQERKRLSKLIR
jgi:hypothetical protein